MSLSIHYHHSIDNSVSFGHAFAESACFLPHGLLISLLDVHRCMGHVPIAEARPV
jgi:hypothetical protein